MSYFSEIDMWLDELLANVAEQPTDEELRARAKQEIKDELLQSYRNGQNAGWDRRS
jgi:hypothetical protein